MNELSLSPLFTARIGALYAAMEAAYDQVAERLPLSCDGCPDNCCDSYFLHHTYVEWAYLWQGFRQLPDHQQQHCLELARHCLAVYQQALERQEWPKVMCPLNRDGRCLLYSHRLMVCRTHGVPASMRRPDGQLVSFPGCFRCQEIVARRAGPPPRMERTHLLRQLVDLEDAFLEGRRQRYAKVKITLAAMLVAGPPELLVEGV